MSRVAYYYGAARMCIRAARDAETKAERRDWLDKARGWRACARLARRNP
jgi:hypothetical protein